MTPRALPASFLLFVPFVLSAADGPRAPQDELASFQLPDGFTAELVADESVMKKAVAFNFDTAGRMWVTTASEYPLDANEQPEKAAALYREGGKDNVLVFDTPWAAGKQTPRVFAGVRGQESGVRSQEPAKAATPKPDSRPLTPDPFPLAMPMAVLPYKDGAIVQHGPDLLHLRDTNGDGRADKREVLLTGFGIQDSHLMPHGFTRGPGDWIYFAQGAFNTSQVKSKEGPVVEAKNCRLMRMKPDGSRFEVTGWGLNNIWGLAIDPRGEIFIQEANDLGYPVVPFLPGAAYPGIGKGRPKPYAPWQPPLANDFKMGGTGLSGLALNEDAATWPAPWTGAMMIANPITNKIQAVRVLPDGPRFRLEKLPDFLVSNDPWFRPVAIQFGPDGALYVIDWYNKIISHNEVPRAHPERDKTRSRIWRIRAKTALAPAPKNFAKVLAAELVRALGSNNQWEANAARFEIIDRGAKELVPELARVASSHEQPTTLRLQCLWALEGLRAAPLGLLQKLTTDPHRAIRREAVRIPSTTTAGDDWELEDSSVMRQRLLAETDPQVRAEAIRQADTVAGIAATKQSDTMQRYAIETLMRFAQPPIEGSLVKMQQGGELTPRGRAAERAFERYLIRAALEKLPAAVAAFLDSLAGQAVPNEGRLLAMLALEPKEGALRLAKIIPEIQRPLLGEELALLVATLEQPSVRAAFAQVLENPSLQAGALEALSWLEPRGEADPSYTAALSSAARDLITREPGEAHRALLVRLARVYRLAELEPQITAALDADVGKPAAQIEALKTLREIGSDNVELFRSLATSPNDELRREALTALASAKNARVVPLLAELWPQLPGGLRTLALDRVASSKEHARPLVHAAREGTITDLDGAALDKLSAVLGDKDADLNALLAETKGALKPVLRLSGAAGDVAETQIDLNGTFTVEAWIKLGPGIGNEDVLLGSKAGPNFNFYDGKFRVYAGPELHDLITARSALKPDTWTHLAVVRDHAGRFCIFINGELDTDHGREFTGPFAAMDIGRGSLGKGTDATLTELRVWNIARTADEIRQSWQISFTPDAKNPLPGSLIRHAAGEKGWGALRGQARIARTRDFPELMTSAEARAVNEKFTKMRTIAEQPGDAAKGRNLFAGICLGCHTVGTEGGNIGPNLSGAGAMGVESLLRNILTPNAQLESGYYRHDIELKNGELLSGFCVSQTPGEFVLRPVGAQDRRVPRSEIKKLTVTKKSLMPEGLLDGLQPAQVSDLFAYLRTLK